VNEARIMRSDFSDLKNETAEYGILREGLGAVVMNEMIAYLVASASEDSYGVLGLVRSDPWRWSCHDKDRHNVQDMMFGKVEEYHLVLTALLGTVQMTV